MSTAMGCKQVWLGVAVLFVVGMADAQWSGLGERKDLARFQPNLPLQAPYAGMPPQQTQPVPGWPVQGALQNSASHPAQSPPGWPVQGAMQNSASQPVSQPAQSPPGWPVQGALWNSASQPVSHPAQSPPEWPVQGAMQNSASQPGFQFQNPAQSSPNAQSHQVIQGPVKPLKWRFPTMPEVPQPPVMHVERSDPVPVRSVAAECTENAVHVEVKKDLFGTGEPIDVSVLTLGGCAPKGEDPALQVLVFESELQGCNSNLIMTEDELVYVFTLIYGNPAQSSSDFPIVRSVTAAGTTVVIECHYPRLHNVSSNALFPVWTPFASRQIAEELLVFTLRLMMDDWVSVRSSTQYYLGELINIEASVIQYNHVPLRVYVDSCVATAVPDLNANPRYSFIENHGCLVDAKLTGSGSHFMPQTQMNKLAFQLETFRFQQVNTSEIYIACFLRATAASLSSDAEHKACSFSANGWVAAYGDSAVCGCCETSCGARKARAVTDEDLQLKGRVTLPPIMVEETVW